MAHLATTNPPSYNGEITAHMVVDSGRRYPCGEEPILWPLDRRGRGRDMRSASYPSVIGQSRRSCAGTWSRLAGPPSV